MTQKTILLAEDNPAQMATYQEILEKAGYTVIPAADGQDALQKLHHMESLPYAVVTDLDMPNKSGFDLIIDIRENKKFSALPVVMHTTEPTPTMQEVAQDEGVDLFMPKSMAKSLPVSIESAVRKRKALTPSENRGDRLEKRQSTGLEGEGLS